MYDSQRGLVHHPRWHEISVENITNSNSSSSSSSISGWSGSGSTSSWQDIALSSSFSSSSSIEDNNVTLLIPAPPIEHTIDPVRYASLALTVLAILSKVYDPYALAFQIKVMLFRYSLTIFDVFSLIYTLFAVSGVQPADQAQLFGLFDMSYLCTAWLYILIFKLGYLALVWIGIVIRYAVIKMREGEVFWGFCCLWGILILGAYHVIAVVLETCKLSLLLHPLSKLAQDPWDPLNDCLGHLQACQFLGNGSTTQLVSPGETDSDRRLRILLGFTSKPPLRWKESATVKALEDFGVMLPGSQCALTKGRLAELRRDLEVQKRKQQKACKEPQPKSRQQDDAQPFFVGDDSVTRR